MSTQTEWSLNSIFSFSAGHSFSGSFSSPVRPVEMSSFPPSSPSFPSSNTSGDTSSSSAMSPSLSPSPCEEKQSKPVEEASHDQWQLERDQHHRKLFQAWGEQLKFIHIEEDKTEEKRVELKEVEAKLANLKEGQTDGDDDESSLISHIERRVRLLKEDLQQIRWRIRVYDDIFLMIAKCFRRVVSYLKYVRLNTRLVPLKFGSGCPTQKFFRPGRSLEVSIPRGCVEKIFCRQTTFDTKEPMVQVGKIDTEDRYLGRTPRRESTPSPILSHQHQSSINTSIVT